MSSTRLPSVRSRRAALRSICLLAGGLVVTALTSCGDSDAIRLYCALDEEHSSKIVDKFRADSGLPILAIYDSEAQKTVGLVSNIVEEAGRPRCDVFWNNELAHTVALGRKGLLTPYASPSAKDIPVEFKDSGNLWTGFAARARVLIVNTEIIKDPKDYPRSMWDLIDPKWKGRCAVARPLTGTTLTHFTALKHVIGEKEFERWVKGMFDNEVRFLQSNGATMREVGAGKLAFAFTDTDDFHVALTKGMPVDCVFPDQDEGQIGTMLIPNSVALVKNGPHPEAARKLVDFILSREVEALLAAAKSAQIPVREGVVGPPAKQIKAIGSFRAMAWKPLQTATDLDAASQAFGKRFGG